MFKIATLFFHFLGKISSLFFLYLFFDCFLSAFKNIKLFQKLTFHGGIYYLIKISIILKKFQVTRNI
jgi:hypothetical protein